MASGASPRSSESDGRCALEVANSSTLLDCMPTELISERGEDPGPVGVVLARAEPGLQRQGDDGRGDVAVDCLLDGPATLAGIGDPALEVGEILAVRLERERREL